jgi:hypothetical protein
VGLIENYLVMLPTIYSPLSLSLTHIHARTYTDTWEMWDFSFFGVGVGVVWDKVNAIYH